LDPSRDPAKTQPQDWGLLHCCAHCNLSLRTHSSQVQLVCWGCFARLPVDEVLEAIKTHLGTKEQAEAFLLVDALDFQVTFGRSMLEEEETTRGYYKIFDLLDTDLSGRLDIKELQAMLNAVRSLPRLWRYVTRTL
jgi:hypothetical protein